MPLHFAAARSTSRSPIARALAKRPCPPAANDNGDAPPAVNGLDPTMRAALTHFATHGLGAAKEAGRLAEQAHRAGDTEAYEWWLAICRALDRRLAEKLGRDMGSDAALIY